MSYWSHTQMKELNEMAIYLLFTNLIEGDDIS